MALEQGQTDINDEPASLLSSLQRIPQIVDNGDVKQIINLQVAAIDLLENTNKSLTDCNNMAQSKLSTTTKLFRRTAKSIAESKKDLDIIYKKISDLKAKLKAERPDLFAGKSVSQVQKDQIGDVEQDQTPSNDVNS